ncbi:MAG: hotdog fold thioesterase [Rhodospirillales bacterium]|nr:hotdog fold thioesterase [Rhodospirillales bacterium]
MNPTRDSEAQVRRLFANDRLAKHLGITLVEAGPGRAVTRLTVAENHLNIYSGGHGGTLFAMADATFGLACNSRAHVSIAISAHIAFVKGVQVGDVLTARATEQARTRRAGTYLVEIRRADDALVATFTGVAHVSDKAIEI